MIVQRVCTTISKGSYRTVQTCGFQGENRKSLCDFVQEKCMNRTERRTEEYVINIIYYIIYIYNKYKSTIYITHTQKNVCVCIRGFVRTFLAQKSAENKPGLT